MRGIRNKIDKGGCPLCLGVEGVKSVLLNIIFKCKAADCEQRVGLQENIKM
jgi:hypothetical protein